MLLGLDCFIVKVHVSAGVGVCFLDGAEELVGALDDAAEPVEVDDVEQGARTKHCPDERTRLTRRCCTPCTSKAGWQLYAR